jgi:alkanesulfonate monooxygenase SsuD/methylene tetrahydromethanopterin reductase-like flavin-dependent oxidoreductase (luciferase family)
VTAPATVSAALPDRLWEETVHPWVAESRRSVRFAVVGAFLPGWAELRDFATRAEELGFDSYWANDHPTRSMDCWTQLTALALATTRMRLMSLVSCVYYRSALLLARQAADVDLISGGRLVLGLGIGDDADEFRRAGVRFRPAGERLVALAETIEATRAMWNSPVASRGALQQPASGQIRPGPVQQPRVPILIGGGGERTTLPMVARYADVSNFGPHEWTGGAFGLDDVRRKSELLRQHCERIGRPFESILRSHYTPLLTLAETASALERKRAAARIPDAGLHTVPVFATVDDAVAHYQALVDAGMQYFLATVNGRDTETVELLAQQLMPALKPAW